MTVPMWLASLRNDSTAEILIEDIGIPIPAMSTIDISDYLKYSELSGSDDLRQLIEDSVLILNDGVIDLSPELGSEFLTLFNRYKAKDDFYTKSETFDSTTIIDTFVPYNDANNDVDLGAHELTSQDITISDMLHGTTTYQTLHDYFSTAASIGRTSGGIISDGTTLGTVKCTAGTGYIKTTASDIGVLKSFDFPATDNISLVASVPNYIVVNYNSGTPNVTSTTDLTTINFQTSFIIGYVYYQVEEGSIVTEIVVSGTLHLTVTDGSAEFYHDTIDFSPYAGTDLGYTPYLFRYTDDNGYTAYAFGGEAVDP